VSGEPAIKFFLKKSKICFVRYGIKSVTKGDYQMTDANQLDIDDCLIENARKIATRFQPGDDEVNWKDMVLDMVRIIDRLKLEKEELREAVHRQVKE
jgi:hypothetical protein